MEARRLSGKDWPGQFFLNTVLYRQSETDDTSNTPPVPDG